MKSKTFLLVLAVLGMIAPFAFSQQVSLHQAGNHVSLGADLTINEFQTYDLGVGSAFSIAGMLDLGFSYAAALAATDEYWIHVGLTYAVTPVKQRTAVPASLQIYGSYAFRTTQSSFLSDNRLVQEGQGYSVGLVLSRRMEIGEMFSVDIGALAEFGRRTDTTSLNFVYDPDTFVGEPDVDYAEYPVVDRLNSLQFGGRLAFGIESQYGHTVSIEVAALVDSSRTFRLRPGINASFSR